MFLMLSGVFTFFVGNLYERNQADLVPFFNFHPWLFLFLVPAIAMRSWSEERKSGTIELLMTLPISTLSSVVGKFLAAWLMIGISLMLTVPLWLSVEYLGQPDRGIIIAGYLGSWIMSSAFLAVGMCMSALNKNQVVAFILSIVICFFFVVSGTGIVVNAFSGWANNVIIDAVTSFSFLYRFESLAKGVMSLSDIVYFVSFAVFWLYACLIIVEFKKAD
jgi:ABC-2 type transport system permease protein